MPPALSLDERIRRAATSGQARAIRTPSCQRPLHYLQGTQGRTSLSPRNKANRRHYQRSSPSKTISGTEWPREVSKRLRYSLKRPATFDDDDDDDDDHDDARQTKRARDPSARRSVNQDSESDHMPFKSPFKPITFKAKKGAVQPDLKSKIAEIATHKVHGHRGRDDTSRDEVIHRRQARDAKLEAKKVAVKANNTPTPQLGKSGLDRQLWRQVAAAQKINQAKKRQERELEELFDENVDDEAQALLKARVEKEKAEKERQKAIRESKEHDRALKIAVKEARKIDQKEKTVELLAQRKEAKKPAAEAERRRLEEKSQVELEAKRKLAAEKLEQARVQRENEEAQAQAEQATNLEINHLNRMQIRNKLDFNRKAVSALKAPAKRTQRTNASENRGSRAVTALSEPVPEYEMGGIFVESDDDVEPPAASFDRATTQVVFENRARNNISSRPQPLVPPGPFDGKELTIRARKGWKRAQELAREKDKAAQATITAPSAPNATTADTAVISALLGRLDAIEIHQNKEAEIAKAHRNTVVALFKGLAATQQSAVSPEKTPSGPVVDGRDGAAAAAAANTLTEQTWRRYQTERKSDVDNRQLRRQRRFLSDKRSSKKRITARLRELAEKEAAEKGVEVDEEKLSHAVETRMAAWEEKRRQSDAKKGFTYSLADSAETQTQETDIHNSPDTHDKTVPDDQTTATVTAAQDDETNALNESQEAMRANLARLRNINAGTSDFAKAASRTVVYLSEDESDISEEDPDPESEPEPQSQQPKTSESKEPNAPGDDDDGEATDGISSDTILPNNESVNQRVNGPRIAPASHPPENHDHPPATDLIHVYIVKKTICKSTSDETPVRTMGRFTSLARANDCARDVLLTDEGGHALNYNKLSEELIEGNRCFGTLHLAGDSGLQVRVWVDIEDDYTGNLVGVRRADLDVLAPPRIFSVVKLFGDIDGVPDANILGTFTSKVLANQAARDACLHCVRPSLHARIDVVLESQKTKLAIQEHAKQAEESGGLFQRLAFEHEDAAFAIWVAETAVVGPLN